MAVTVAVAKEKSEGEKRVALVPEVVSRLTKSGVRVLVESGAGEEAYYTDGAYSSAGAEIMHDRKSILSQADVLLVLQPPAPAEIALLREKAIIIGFMSASKNVESIRKMKERKLTAFALELVPRITRAQSMDALSSQATIGGYKAALVAADYSPKLLPMLTTAAGTIRPAKVLILGAGVAGLMAIATARRLGAMVEAYDVRRAAGEQVRSLGARFLELQIDAEAAGGYARELTPEEKQKEQAMVNEAVSQADAVITTANIPGRKAPRLISKEMVSGMKPGSVIVDLAAETGGNCELTKAGGVVVENDVTIVGPLNLPGQIPFHASQMYSKNLQSFLGLVIDREGKLAVNFDDEILKGSLMVHDGEIRHAQTKELVEGRQ